MLTEKLSQFKQYLRLVIEGLTTPGNGLMAANSGVTTNHDTLSGVNFILSKWFCLTMVDNFAPKIQKYRFDEK